MERDQMELALAPCLCDTHYSFDERHARMTQSAGEHSGLRAALHWDKPAQRTDGWVRWSVSNLIILASLMTLAHNHNDITPDWMAASASTADWLAG